MSYVQDKKRQTQHLENGKEPLDGPQPSGQRSTGLTVDENLVRADNEDRVTPYLVFLIAIAAIAGFLFGYDTAVVGSALPLVGTDIGHALTASEQEIITAGTTIGAIFGAAILGGLADKLGRKWAIFLSDVAFTIGAILIASSYSLAQIIVGRIVLGVGVGGAAVIGPLYITELAPTAVRGRCIGIVAFFIPFGQTVANAIAAGVQNVNHAWRILFALGVVPSMVQLTLMHFLPESPRVMILRGQNERARTTLRRIYSDTTDEIIDLKLSLAEEYVAATTQMQRQFSFKERCKRYWSHKPYRRAIIAVSGVQAAGQLTGYNTLLYYSGTIFGLLGLKNSSAAGLIPSGCNALFILVGLSIVDRAGRRRLLLCGYPIMIAGLVFACVVFYYMTKPTGFQLDTNHTYPTALTGCILAAIVIFSCAFGISVSHIVWYQAEYLALEIRAAGSAVATMACWIANLIVSVTYLSELENLTAPGTYGLYIGFLLLGFIFIIFCYPESKGLSIDETASIFEEGYGVKKAHAMFKEKRAIAAGLQTSSS